MGCCVHSNELSLKARDVLSVWYMQQVALVLNLFFITPQLNQWFVPVPPQTANAYASKLYHLQNRVFRHIGPRTALSLQNSIRARLYSITKFCKKQAAIIKIIEIQMYRQLGEEKPCMGSITGLNLVMVR